MRPILCLYAAIVAQAVTTAVLGATFSVADSILMLMIGAGIATIVGLIGTRVNPAARPSAELRAAVRPAMLRLNGWTALCFFAFFIGVVVHDASVVFTLEVCLAPLVTLLYAAYRGRRLAGGHRPNAVQWMLTIALAMLGAAMAGAAHIADPSRVSALLIGGLLGIVARISVGGIAITSRALGAAGTSVQYVAGNRFHLTYAAAAVVFIASIAGGNAPGSVGHILAVAGIAVVALVAPIYLLQYAMQKLTPLTVTAALAALPAATLLMELLLGQQLGWLTLLLAFAVVPISFTLVLAQTRPPSPRGASKTTSQTLEGASA